MTAWISQNLATILIVAVLAVIVAVILIIMVKNKRRGKTACGCGCSGCPMSGSCHPEPPKKAAEAEHE